MRTSGQGKSQSSKSEHGSDEDGAASSQMAMASDLRELLLNNNHDWSDLAEFDRNLAQIMQSSLKELGGKLD